MWMAPNWFFKLYGSYHYQGSVAFILSNFFPHPPQSLYNFHDKKFKSTIDYVFCFKILIKSQNHKKMPRINKKWELNRRKIKRNGNQNCHKSMQWCSKFITHLEHSKNVGIKRRKVPQNENINC